MTRRNFVTWLYNEHKRTLDMIDHDRKYYFREIDFQEEFKSHATNLQTRLNTLQSMGEFLSVIEYIEEGDK